jgi:hypothetical protein
LPSGTRTGSRSRADRCALTTSRDGTDDGSEHRATPDELAGSPICSDAIPLLARSALGVRRDGKPLPIHAYRFQIQQQIPIRHTPEN